MSERLEVQRTIPADAATIFRVVSDPNGGWPIIPESALKAGLGILERTVRAAAE